MFKVVLHKDKWEKMLKEQDEYHYTTPRIESDAFDVSIKGNRVTISLKIETLFKKEITEHDKLKHIVNNLIKASLETDSLASVTYSTKDLVKFEKLIKALDKKKRIIRFDVDLTIIVDHPIFDNISYNLKCWKNKKLVHPKLWKDDIEYLKNYKFEIVLTEEQISALNKLAIQEDKLFKTAYIYRSQKGYRLLLYSLQEDTIKALTEKCQIWYNKQTSTGIERVLLTFIEDELDYQVEKEQPKQLTEIKKLMEKGYNSYNCFMFTLPSILLFLKRHNIKVIGGKQLIPRYPMLRIKKNEIKLWDFQKEALESWKKNEMLGTIALPTGSGKTIIALKCVEEVARKRVLIVVPTVELVRQWKDMLIEHLNVPEKKIGLYYAQSKEVKDITIITFQSGHRKIAKEVGEKEEGEEEVNEELVKEIVKLSESSAFIILDEGHHAPAPVFQKIMINVKCPYRLSLTATPYREDKNESLAFLAIGDVVYRKDYASLAKKKVVCPIHFERIFIRPTENEEKVLSIRAELNIRRRASYGDYGYRNGWVNGASDKSLEELQDDLENIYSELFYNKLKEEAGYSVGTRIKILDVLSFAENKFMKLQQICKLHVKDKILVFNQRVAGAKTINHFLQDKGFDSNVLTGTTLSSKRKELFKEFTESESGILVTTTVLDEGIDVPDANVVIIFNGSKSKRQMIQRVGRGCRYRQRKVEYVYELITKPETLIDVDEKIISILIESLKQSFVHSQKYVSQWDVGGWHSGLHNQIQVEARKLLLLEIAKSRYRDISDVINMEEQKNLLSKFKLKVLK